MKFLNKHILRRILKGILYTFLLASSILVHAQVVNCNKIKAQGVVFCKDKQIIEMSADPDNGDCSKIQWFDSPFSTTPLATGCSYNADTINGTFQRFYIRYDGNAISTTTTETIGWDFNSPELQNPSTGTTGFTDRANQLTFVALKDAKLNSFQMKFRECNSNPNGTFNMQIVNLDLPNSSPTKVTNLSFTFPSGLCIENEIVTATLTTPFNLKNGTRYQMLLNTTGRNYILDNFKGIPGDTLAHDSAFKSIIGITASGDPDLRKVAATRLQGFGPFFNWNVTAVFEENGCPIKEVNLVRRCFEVCDDNVDNDSDGKIDEACAAFPCNGKLYQTILNPVTDESSLFQVNIKPNVTITELINLGTDVNATGYSPTDNLIYTKEYDLNGKIIRMANDGTFEVLDNIITKDSIPFNSFASDVGSDGNIYYLVFNGNRASFLYVIDSKTLVELKRINLGTIPRVADITFNPENGKLYGVTDAGTPKSLFEIDPILSKSKNLGKLSMFNLDGSDIQNTELQSNNSTVGAIYFQPGGKLLAYGSIMLNNGSDGKQDDLIEIDPVTLRATLLSKNNVNQTSSNDGASCPYSLIFNKIASADTVKPGDEFTYTLETINLTQFGIRDVNFEDIIDANLKLLDISTRNNEFDLSTMVNPSISSIDSSFVRFEKLFIKKDTSKLYLKVKVKDVVSCDDDTLKNQAILTNLPKTVGSTILSFDPNSNPITNPTGITETTLLGNGDKIKIKIIGDSIYCDGDSLYLETDQPKKSVWVFPNGTRFKQDSLRFDSVKIDKAGLYKVYAESASSCGSDTIDVNIVVNPLPIFNITDPGNICIGDTATLSSTNPNLTFQWSKDTLKANQTNNVQIKVEVANTQTLQLIATDVNGCIDSTERTFRGIPLPSLDIPDKLDICFRDSAEVTTPDTLTYVWTSATFVRDNSSINEKTNFFPSDTTKFFVEYVNANNCKNKDSILINVIILPKPAVGPFDPKCIGESIVFNSNRTSPKTWYRPDETVMSGNPPQLLNLTKANEGFYFMKYDSLGCPSDTARAFLSIKDLPIPVPVGIEKLCAGDTLENFEIQVNNKILSTIQWRGDTVYFDDTTIVNPKFPAIYPIRDLVVLVTDNEGCVGSDTFYIEAHPIPSIQLSASNQNPCFGESISLSTTPLGFVNYLWESLQDPTLFLPSSNDSGGNIIPNVATDTIVVIAEDLNGCLCVDSLEIKVNTGLLPKVKLSAPKPICEGSESERIFIESSENLGDNPSFFWQRVLKNGNIEPLGTENSIVFPSLDSSQYNFQDEQIKLIVKTFTPCLTPLQQLTSDSVKLRINKYPILESLGKKEFCEPTNSDLSGNDRRGINPTIYWMDKDKSTVIDPDNVLNLINISRGESFVLVGENKDQKECKTELPVQITFKAPAVDIAVSEDKVFVGSLVDILASHNGDQLAITSTPSTPIVWTNEQEQVQSTQIKQETVFFATSTLNGCKAIDSIRVIIVQKIIAPYFFSPNGDGNNDTWIVTGLEGYDDSEVVVFNRWGSPMARFKGKMPEWDGKVNGLKVPDGVYYYVVKSTLGENSYSFSGNVTIME